MCADGMCLSAAGVHPAADVPRPQLVQHTAQSHEPAGHPAGQQVLQL
jgi:hypothetical protein